MTTLYINNSLSKLEGMDRETRGAIRALMSYEYDWYNGREWKKTKKCLMDKVGNFPSGLLYRVLDYLVGNRIAHDVIDRTTVPKASPSGFNLSLPVEPYPTQIEASRALLDGYSRGIISAPTGSGKSVIIALIIKNLGVSTLVVVPNLELKRQLTESFKQWFGKDVVTNDPYSHKGSLQIAICNIASLDPNVKPKGYDCLIFDEFHHAAAESYLKLNIKAWTDIYYRVGVTATPFRSQDHENIVLESMISKVIYEITYDQAVSLGQIVPVEAYYLDIPKQKLGNFKNSWKTVYNALVVNNEARNLIIHDLLVKFHANNLVSLCLVKEIKHGTFISNDGSFPFVKGENDDNKDVIDRFSKGEIKTLVATTGVMGEGVDTKAVEYVVIAGLGKSRNAFMQQVGRGLRRWKGKESCKVFILRDTSHRWTLEHFKAQSKILLEEYGVIPVALDI